MKYYREKQIEEIANSLKQLKRDIEDAITISEVCKFCLSESLLLIDKIEKIISE